MTKYLVSLFAALCCTSAYAVVTNSYNYDWPLQCDISAAVQSGCNKGTSTGVCAVPTGPTGETKGICSHPLSQSYPNASSNQYSAAPKAPTFNLFGHANGFFNACASGYADVLQTSGAVDAGYGCCSSVTKVVTQDARNGPHFKYMGEACDSTRGTGGANGFVMDCCGGAIPLTCGAANLCCIPTGSAGPAMSTGYADPMPGMCCSGYASTNGTNFCLASPDGGNGGCMVTGCGAGYCDVHTGNCTALDLGEPCEYKTQGDGFATGWVRSSQMGPNGGQPTIGCYSGMCAHQSSYTQWKVDSTARCCLDRDLQPALGTADAGLWCHSGNDCCTGVCEISGLCSKANNGQACYDDGDCARSNAFGVCNGAWSWGSCQYEIGPPATCAGDGGTCVDDRDCCNAGFDFDLSHGPYTGQYRPDSAVCVPSTLKCSN